MELTGKQRLIAREVLKVDLFDKKTTQSRSLAKEMTSSLTP